MKGAPFSKTAKDILEEGEDDVKSAWPLWVGLHTCYNGEHKRMQDGNMEQILNFRRSSDCSLQLENMKLESLVIVDQHATVNLYLSLVHTARHIMGAGLAQSILNNIWTDFNTFFSAFVYLIRYCRYCD